MVRVSRLHAAALLLLVLVVAGCAGYWWQLTRTHEQLRRETLAQAAHHSSQLAEAVAGQTALLVRMIDFAVRHLEDDYAGGDRKAFEATVRTVLDVFPAGAVPQIGVIDRDGYLAYSNLGMKDRVYLGDREHFKAHLAGGEDRLFISKPVFGRVSRTWSIQFTRPLRVQGRFAGVVVLSVAPEYIADSLLQPELGAQDVIAVFYPDGAYASRSQNLHSVMGKAVPAERPFVGADAPVKGVFRVAATFDNVWRTYAWRRLDVFPLIVNVGLAEAAIMNPVELSIADSRWRNLVSLGMVMLFAAVTATLLARLARQQRVMSEAEARYRSFFEHNTAVKLVIDPADGTIVDANPAAADYYGYPRQQLLAMRIGDINCLSPEALAAELASAASDERSYFNFPHRLASGEVRQVEVYSGPIVIDGRTLLFSVIHDITARKELGDRLRESEELHRTLFETMAEGVLVVRAEDARITAWNDSALTILGVSAEELVTQRVRVVGDDGAPLSVEQYPSRLAARGKILDHHVCGTDRPDGQRIWMSVSSRPLHRQGDAAPYAAVLSFSDITALIEAEARQRLAQSVFEAAGEGIMVTDGENRIIAVNPAFSEITGYRREESLGRNPSFLASGRHDAAFYRSLWQRLIQDGHWEGELTNRRKDGQLFVEWVKMTAIDGEAGRPRRYVAVFSDVTERKRREEAIWHQANFDALTGLPNRELLGDRLQRALAQAQRKHAKVAVLFVDLDRFKPVNDQYGHAAGDELLRQVVRRLDNILRDEDTVARLGGDEFIVVLPDLGTEEAPARAADKIISALSAPFRVGEDYVEISCSIGIALYPRDAQDPEGLINRADAAMYRAKEAGRATWSLV